MGTLSFGLVSVPVKLYSAVTRKTVHFHQIHALEENLGTRLLDGR